LIKLGAPGISLNERLNGSDIKIGRQDAALLKRLEHLLFYASISGFVPPQPFDGFEQVAFRAMVNSNIIHLCTS
jgi:hypothetical protein